MSKTIYTLSLLLYFFSCTPPQKPAETQEAKENTVVKRELIENIQTSIDASKSKGSVLIFNPINNTFYSNDFKWAEKSFLPASTFKVPTSIIAMELGIIKNDSSIFYWDGEKRFQERWEKDLNFREALQPSYQYLAREIGVDSMISNLQKIDYPGMVFDSSNIDLFWLSGKSQITSFEQVEFSTKFYTKKLPISENTYNSMKRMLIQDKNESYRLSGKSGWSYTNGIDNCWLIGYIEPDQKVYFFATNLEPPLDVDFNTYPQIRLDITLEAFNQLGFIKTIHNDH